MKIHRYSRLQCNIFSISVIYYLYITDTSSAWKFFTDSSTAVPFSVFLHSCCQDIAYLVSIIGIWVRNALCCDALSQYILAACIFKYLSANASPPLLINYLILINLIIESLTITLFKKISLGYSCIVFVSLYKTCSLGYWLHYSMKLCQ